MSNSATQSLPASSLKELEILLCCGICLEYMSTSMMLMKCSHNFCSLCIRRYINYKQQCPTCRETAVDTDLRNNRQLDDIIRVFTVIKPKLQQAFTESGSSQRSNETKKTSSNSSQVERLKLLTSSSFAQQSTISDDLNKTLMDDLYTTQENVTSSESYVFSPFSGNATSSSNSAYNIEFINLSCVHNKGLTSNSLSKDPAGVTTSSLIKSPVDRRSKAGVSDWLDRSAAGSTESGKQNRAPCPVCTVEIPINNMNAHIDRCLLASEKKDALRSTVKRKPLAKLVYNLIGDKELKKKMNEMGLSVIGDRKTLIERHREFVLRYNSECDSAEPKSAEQIIKEMQAEENDKQSRSGKSSLNVTTGSIKLDKGASSGQIETAQKAYVKEHKSQFADLIAAVRKRNQVSFSKPTSSQLSSLTKSESNASIAGSENDSTQLIEPMADRSGYVSIEKTSSESVKNLGSTPTKISTQSKSAGISSFFCRSPVFGLSSSVEPDISNVSTPTKGKVEAGILDEGDTQFYLESDSDEERGMEKERVDGENKCMVDSSKKLNYNLLSSQQVSDNESDSDSTLNGSQSSKSLLTDCIEVNKTTSKTFSRTESTGNLDIIPDSDDDDTDDDFGPSRKFNLSFSQKKPTKCKTTTTKTAAINSAGANDNSKSFDQSSNVDNIEFRSTREHIKHNDNELIDCEKFVSDIVQSANNKPTHQSVCSADDLSNDSVELFVNNELSDQDRNVVEERLEKADDDKLINMRKERKTFQELSYKHKQDRQLDKSVNESLVELAIVSDKVNTDPISNNTNKDNDCSDRSERASEDRNCTSKNKDNESARKDNNCASRKKDSESVNKDNNCTGRNKDSESASKDNNCTDNNEDIEKGSGSYATGNMKSGDKFIDQPTEVKRRSRKSLKDEQTTADNSNNNKEEATRSRSSRPLKKSRFADDDIDTGTTSAETRSLSHRGVQSKSVASSEDVDEIEEPRRKAKRKRDSKR